jgi:hypothetical protein
VAGGNSQGGHAASSCHETVIASAFSTQMDFVNDTPITFGCLPLHMQHYIGVLQLACKFVPVTCATEYRYALRYSSNPIAHAVPKIVHLATAWHRMHRMHIIDRVALTEKLSIWTLVSASICILPSPVGCPVSGLTKLPSLGPLLRKLEWNTKKLLAVFLTTR